MHIGLQPLFAQVPACDFRSKPKEELDMGIGTVVSLTGIGGLPHYNGGVAKIICHDPRDNL